MAHEIGGFMTYRHRNSTKTIMLGCGLLLLMVTVLLGCASGGADTGTTGATSTTVLVSIDEQDIASASMDVRQSAAQGGEMSETPIDLTDASKRAELVALMNGLEKIDWGGSEGIIFLSLNVLLVDGQEYCVIWWPEGKLELVIFASEDGQVRSRTGVVSPEMSAFMEPYLEHQ